MKRIQLFEFEDQKWFPRWLRTSITNLIVVLNKIMQVDEVLALLLAKHLDVLKLKTIVDLGSGSGGSMPQVLDLLKKQHGMNEVNLIMTDLYPNPQTISRFSNPDSDIVYYSRPVNAADLAHTPAGLKTMVNCFHHMPPAVAKQILRSAQENKQPLLVYELSDNKIPTVLWWLFLPVSMVIMFLMVLLMTPFVRPLTFRQLFFTYIVPVIPVFYFWDGQASMPRNYTLDDYDLLLPEKTTDYKWEKGYAVNSKKQKKGTYLIGTPVR